MSNNVEKLMSVLVAMGHWTGFGVSARYPGRVEIQLPKALIADPVEGPTVQDAAFLALNKLASIAQPMAAQMHRHASVIDDVYAGNTGSDGPP